MFQRFSAQSTFPKIAAIGFCVLLFLTYFSRGYLFRATANKTSGPGSSRPVASEDAHDPHALLSRADYFYWLNNGPKAAPLYGRAEELFAAQGDAEDQIHAKVGRLRSEAETMSFVDLSRYLGQVLDKSLIKHNKELRLWCLMAKGYTDIEIDYRAAKREWLEAKDIAQALGESRWVTRANGELGLIAFMEGHPGNAARLLGGALLSAMASGDTGGQIRFLELLGRGFEEVNRHSEALRFFQRAINLANDNPDAGTPFMAYEGKARALAGLGRIEEAQGILRDALAKAAFQRKRGHQAQVLILLGDLSSRTSNLAEAISYLESAANIAKGDQFYSIDADAMIELAKLYRDCGDLATAENRAAEGLAASQRVGDRYYVPRNLTLLADLKARRGRVAEANALYDQAEDVIEGMLISVDEPYWNSSLAASMSQTYLQHFELAAKQGDVPAAFRVLERVRGRTLARALTGKKTFPLSESDQTASLEAAVATLQRHLMQSNDASQRQQLLDQLAEYERRLGLAWTNSDFSSRELPVRPVPLPSVQNDLKPGEVVLEYVLDDPTSFCLAIARTGAHLHRLPAGRKEVEGLTRSYIADIREKHDGSEAAKQLYNLLVQPVTDASAATRMIIVPDGPLNLLPFEALKDSHNEYLLRSHELTYVPSATILDTLRNSEKSQLAPKPLLAVGDVVYQNQGDAGRKLAKAASLSARLERGVADLSGISLHDLPQTREEVEEIGKIFGPDSVVLTGKNATESVFKKEPLDKFQILHLAVHGFADTQYPERSALVLGRDANSTEDGLLQVREIIRLKLNTELATLSACDSGVGKLQGEEGISNLVEAFLVAGSRSVVASLWSADDTSASALMETFYKRLAGGETVSSALGNAKLDMLSKFGNDLNPYYWAAFISVGETSSPIGITK